MLLLNQKFILTKHKSTHENNKHGFITREKNIKGKKYIKEISVYFVPKKV